MKWGVKRALNPNTTILMSAESSKKAKALEAVNEAAESDMEKALELARAYLKKDAKSAQMNAAIARLISHVGDAEEAAKHYKQALSLDEDVRDPELEEWFENVAGIRLELTSAHGESVKTGIPTPDAGAGGDDEVAPITMDKIASLKERRGDKEGGKNGPGVPPTDLTASEPDEVKELGVVDHYAVDGIHPASAVSVAPPPEMHAVADNPIDLEKVAMEQTGTVTSGVFSHDDIKAMQSVHADQAAKEKLSALTVAIIVHAAVFFILGLIVISVPRQDPPEIVAVASPSDEVVLEIEKKEAQKVTKPNPSSASRVNIMAVANTSSVAVPVVIDPIQTIEPIGAGNDFGMAMNFSAEVAGNVSFFGSATKANKVVFVVDASASMNQRGAGITKFELMQEELKKTVKGLSSGVEFQIIFFSGPCWFVGDKVPDLRDERDDWHGKNFWHYKGGNVDELEVGKYRQATPGTIRKTLREIDETPATYGTDWRVPLQMAMVMEPDVIYFMTDGAVGKHPSKPPVVDDVLKLNRRRSGAKINSICLMVPKATEELRELADGSRGEFTLVLEDGTPLRGKELEKYERDNK